MNKKNIIVIVICIFLFFISNTFLVIDRKYSIMESSFKRASALITGYFKSKLYEEKLSNNITNSKINYLEKENDKLKKSIDLKNTTPNTIIASVYNHNLLYWYNRLEIDKGTKSGIKINDPVINSEGLIGFISKTSNNVSEVVLLTNVNNSYKVSVLIKNGDNYIPGMLSKYDNKTKLFKITNVTSKDKIEKSSSVVLSGYDKESYKDIYIGKVVKEKNSNYGLTKTIYVKSDVDFDNIMFVAVEVDK